MSRSAPTDTSPNPCKRWLEWNGEKGNLRFYDKEATRNVEVDLPFQFILLDRLSCITGWHNNSESGIFSNEVRDTRSDTLVVKAFKMKEPIASGFYEDVRDKVKANGGKFTINAYIAYTNEDNQLILGSLRMHGAAMSAWIDFEKDKAVRPFLYKKGIKIASTLHGEKGSGKNKIEWEAPVFEIIDVPAEVNGAATEIDSQKLQPYLTAYFKRNRTEQAESPSGSDDSLQEEPPPSDSGDDEIPFS